VHDTSTAGTPTPTNPDLDERVCDILSHILGEAHADGDSDKLIASVTKQAASQHFTFTSFTNPMYDEYGEFRGRVLINQHEWQVHYFDALDTKPSTGNDEFHDALEQLADDPDSVIDLIVYRANRARDICDHDTVEAARKFVMSSEPDYGQLCPCLGWLPVDAIKKTFEHTTQLARMPMSTILKK
jgi:hypothetical protein